MSLRKFFVMASLVAVATVAAPTRASADWLFTPFVGSTFGGSANVTGGGENFSSDFNRNFTYGAALDCAFIGWIRPEMNFDSVEDLRARLLRGGEAALLACKACQRAAWRSNSCAGTTVQLMPPPSRSVWPRRSSSLIVSGEKPKRS